MHEIKLKHDKITRKYELFGIFNLMNVTIYSTSPYLEKTTNTNIMCNDSAHKIYTLTWWGTSMVIGYNMFSIITLNMELGWPCCIAPITIILIDWGEEPGLAPPIEVVPGYQTQLK